MAEYDKLLELGGHNRFRWNSDRPHGVITMDLDGVRDVIKRSGSVTTARKAYDECEAAIKWLINMNADDPIVKTTYQSQDPNETRALLDAARKKEKRSSSGKAARSNKARPCDCGCEGITGGGLYLPGHDAKHKSLLIKAALEGDENEAEAAEALLASKGWTKFLDKKREILSKPAHVKRAEKVERSQADVEAAAKRLALMKEAGNVLVAQGRYRRDSVGYVEITTDNAQLIIDGTI